VKKSTGSVTIVAFDEGQGVKNLGQGAHRQYGRLTEEIEAAAQRSATVPAQDANRSDKCCHDCGGR
jgi:hypothetical protein